MLSSKWLYCLAVSTLLLSASVVHGAQIICVDSASGLDSALGFAEVADVRINLVQGSYDTRITRLNQDFGSFPFDAEGSITIVGGYNANCTSRSANPALTVLFGDADTDILIRNGIDVEFESVTFESLRYMSIDANQFGSPAEHSLRMTRVMARNMGPISVIASEVSLNQVAITGSIPLPPPANNCAFLAFAFDLDVVKVESSLFADNGGDGLCVGHDPGRGWGNAFVYNSIFWGNAGYDIVSVTDESSSDILLRANLLQTTNIVPAPTSPPSGTLTANPQFVDAAGGDYRLGDFSPAKDSGYILPPSGLPSIDIQGLPRIIGAGLDRGPFENQAIPTQFIYTVTNTNNSGSGSLRQALINAESAGGLNGITFNIPGSGCPKVIALQSELPPITQPLVIQGYSQPGAIGNNSESSFNASLCVVLEDAGSVSRGLVIDDTAPPDASVTIEGLGFNGFATAAIDVRGGGDHHIQGNQFAGSVGAVTLDNGNYAIRVSRLAAPVLSGTQIGGDEPGQRNLIGSAAFGILLNGGFVRDTLITNNFIGVAANGSSALPNNYGISNTGALDTTVRGNWISGNAVDGVYVNGTGTYLTGNRIGLRADTSGGSSLPNGGWGVRITHAGSGLPSLNLVGSGIGYLNGVPIPIGAGNTIANNIAGGIRTDSGLGHRLSRNLVYANGRPEIDIAEVGFTFNDNDGDAAAATLSNRGINYPQFDGFPRGGPTQGSVTGTLQSINGDYRVEVYSAPACNGGGLATGESRVYHGAKTVSIRNAPSGQNGSASFGMPVSASAGAANLIDRGFVMLAIDQDGNTSELSLCLPYQSNDVIFANGFEP